MTDIKRAGNLYHKITDIENIKTAILNASKKKKKRPQVQEILGNIDKYALELQDLLVNKTYTPSPYIEEVLKDGNNKKERLASIGLKLKHNWQVYRLDCRPLDFVGFRFFRTHILMRKRNALRIKRRVSKMYKKGYYAYRDCAALVSYFGWFKYSNSYNFYKKNIEPYVDITKMKEVISNESKKQRLAQVF